MFIFCWSHIILCEHEGQCVWALTLTDKMDQYPRNFVRKIIPRGNHHPSYFQDLPLVAIWLGTKRLFWQQHSQIHRQYQSPYLPNYNTVQSPTTRTCHNNTYIAITFKFPLFQVTDFEEIVPRKFCMQFQYCPTEVHIQTLVKFMPSRRVMILW
jgi:hypothetical protein